MKILIAEDDSISRILLEYYVAKHNHSLFSCSDGLQAKSVLVSNASFVDVIITDIMMPNFNGIELAAYIRNDLKILTPIVVVSSLAPLVGWNKVFNYWIQKPLTVKKMDDCFDFLIHKNNSLSETKKIEKVDISDFTKQFKK